MYRYDVNGNIVFRYGGNVRLVETLSEMFNFTVRYIESPPGWMEKGRSKAFINQSGFFSKATHSFFKLPVVRLLNPEKVDAVKSRLLFEVTEQAILDTSEGSSPDEKEKIFSR
ncbi:hypothetical protein GWK47_001947 [Chionoecetes opilio]|uniref:Uncharacterized protein n=1 Tax=Chionoecetes opilio TaxID=41210 RepID=A0A8J4Y0C5_CHIOP|nr:hypothetical protein GWK47_001947 [Chionoecetes opilio]